MAVKMTLILLIVALMAECIVGGPMVNDPNRDPLPEENMNVTQMILYNGYPVENHDVTTEDGYILSVQRIPYGRNGNCKNVTSKPVVFLQHGLLAAATNWVTNLPNQSFGFVLADKCFDVWLGNMRGNTYCRRHVNYSVHSDEFWDFSFDEMAKYDLPAMINYVINTTSQPYLYYAGHSQGTMIGFIEFGRNAELIKRVKAFYALAPVSTVTYMGGALKYLADLSPEIQFFFKLFGVREFLPSNFVVKWFAQIFCKAPVLEMVCSDFLFLIAGNDQKQLNETRVPVYVSHTPAGTSVKNVVHFAQLHNAKKFQMYDYGSADKNRQHYGQDTPPEYNVSKVAVPTALYWAGHDVLADPMDVKSLMPKLPTLTYNKFIEAWEHLDFVWGMDATTEVYNDIIKHILEKEREMGKS
ncbi:gastric triacylglycerol lipase [Exaiptasia diaphana]|uniref:Lipase n=1 Tax=Exaiptasia diaphana TaxID=2652724 RepID=A0A913XU29_EXADI|nr:gastric triacylglycerol lipase [Exaiptasia diaphana]